jgi:hypothetical protein
MPSKPPPCNAARIAAACSGSSAVPPLCAAAAQPPLPPLGLRRRRLRSAYSAARDADQPRPPPAPPLSLLSRPRRRSPLSPSEAPPLASLCREQIGLANWGYTGSSWGGFFSRIQENQGPLCIFVTPACLPHGALGLGGTSFAPNERLLGLLHPILQQVGLKCT